MKVNGKISSNMDMAFRNGLTARDMRGSGRREK
jgi:hypothetical protein